ncbi:SGNH/GDSL hydrolase family protein [Alkalicoccobacillus gibsonii]|uniref:SGNH/GDSL hydrolase family protein n=1 Tax=Alkalicoccobacillus gibsonii TaxID=79881 RepID=UPI003F7B9666
MADFTQYKIDNYARDDRNKLNEFIGAVDKEFKDIDTELSAPIGPNKMEYVMAELMYEGSHNFAITVNLNTSTIQLAPSGNLLIQHGFDRVSTPSASRTFNYGSLSGGTIFFGVNPDDLNRGLFLTTRTAGPSEVKGRFWCALKIWNGRVLSTNPSIVRVVGGDELPIDGALIADGSVTPNKLSPEIDLQKSIGKFLRDELEHPSKPVQIKITGSSSVAGVGGTGYSPTGEAIGNTGWRSNEAGFCWVNQLKKYLESKYNGLNEYGISNRFFRVQNEAEPLSGTSKFSYDTNARLKTLRRIFGPNVRIVIPFYGTSFTYFYTKGGSCWNMGVTIDGGSTETVNAYISSGTEYGSRYQKTGLSNGYHEAVITPLPTSGVSDSNGRIIIESVQFNKRVVVKNWAASGRDTKWMVDNRTTLIENADTIVWEQMGANDRSAYTLEEVKAQHRLFIQYAKDRGKEVILSSSQAVENSNDYNVANRKFYAIDLDRAFRDLSDVEGVYFASVYDGFIKYLQYNRETTISELLSDAQHPNDFGYQVLFEHLMQELDMPVLKPEDKTMG